MNELWSQLAARAGVTLANEQHEKLARYLDLLLEANQRMNLTRIDTREAAEVGHVADALTLLPYLPREAHRLADVGSGGGVPGILLAIARPDVRVLLIESTQKKAKFLEETAAALGLTNVAVSAKRVEDEARGPNREAFDVVAARAVGAMNVLSEWCLPLVRRGGKLLAMKGARIADELPAARRALKLLGGGEPRVHPVELPGTEHHVIVDVPKVAKTPAAYPRNGAQLKAKPL
jgi:16S rRNA (guanine527-N7)-methyltransferase